ncbi:hypothetical protein WJ96_05790 [Burkholderia ubonensis]|uniref:Lipoprotein n=1 Tax=Burkholderia ubonensis TaxID=101571 RepID=A0AAW3N260_9BURK|nr:hypothetical protein [Burkholderia ubonensis]KVP75268.1 hypothetical protein WJ93_07585 [Burkholderia ubonensis]KVP96736.1 hypothetical protein WJ97_12715 [Burkholderia ubonensis]KVP98081.1 hypothetical protein WJ96_05790 [Burkholderia ubonensis]KVZ92778.1 hypothetical protein WL25_17450 [Burkholderia ubonensis]
MRIFKVFKTLALMGAVALTLSGCGPTEEELVSAVGKAMEAGLPADFAKLEFAERPYGNSPASTLVFQGKAATIVSVSKPRLRGYWYPEVVMYGLAVTRNGRYFEFTYLSALHSEEKEVRLPFFEAVPCIEASCRAIRDARQLSVTSAKNWFFNSDSFTPERYKALFNEDAPPQRITA